MKKLNISSDIFSFYKTVVGSIMTQGVALVISFAGSVLLARTLGAEGRGVVAWIISLGSMAAVFSQFGMHFVNRRFVAEDPKHAGDLISMTFIICLGMSVITLPIALFFGVSDEIGRNNNTALIIGLMISPVMAIAVCLNDMLVGLHKSKEFNISSLIQKALNTIFIIILILSHKMQPITAIGAILASFFTQLLLILWYLREHITCKIRDVKWLLSHTGLYMFSNYISNVSFMCSYAIIPIFVGSMYSLKDAGWYAACASLIEATRTIPRVIAMYTMPKLVKIKNQLSRKAFKVNIILVTILIMFFVSVVLYFLGNWLIPFLFGKDFIGATAVFKTILYGLVFSSIFLVTQAFIGAEDKRWKITIAPIALLITTIILSFILIPKYGAIGGAYVWGTAHLAANLTLVFSLRK